MLIQPWRHTPNHVIRLSFVRSLTTTRSRWQAPVTNVEKPNYSETVHLPKTSMPMANDPSKDEVLKKRTTEDLYRWQVRILSYVPLPKLTRTCSGKMTKVHCLSFMMDLHMPMETCILVWWKYTDSDRRE